MAESTIDFKRLVWQMWEAQKKYFSSRTSASLKDAKALEALVDETIKKWDEKQAKAAQTVNLGVINLKVVLSIKKIRPKSNLYGRTLIERIDPVI